MKNGLFTLAVTGRMNGELSKMYFEFDEGDIVWYCMVSRYRDIFADKLIDLVRNTGVSYFKWDMLDQRGCNAPGHLHGDEGHSARERADCFAFRSPQTLAYIAEKIREACPEAIFDYDVTEPRRAFGLAFLATGRYFLMNHGPYYRNLDLPARYLLGRQIHCGPS